ncbi:hypothetical protein [Aminobacter aminovorans]|uniref:hypothetical protein n=1 Tax=Aminobacter aminovorans TaxID=83263 RepID=UPI00285C2EA9|nr:hypothetical protein [Aminobacter aminovorans]MDR7219942.1 hypothetical protein [Aminobacter aminovorans]
MSSRNATVFSRTASVLAMPTSIILDDLRWFDLPINQNIPPNKSADSPIIMSRDASI